MLYSDCTLPENFEKQYEIIYKNNLYDYVIKGIDYAQYSEIISAIDKKIKFKLDCISYSMTSQIRQILDKINYIAEESQKAFGSLNENNLDELIKNIESLSNINGKDIATGTLKSQSLNSNTTSKEIGNDTISLIRRK